MKKLWLLLGMLAALMIAAPCMAGHVTLMWDANTETDLAGYKIYYRMDQGGEPYDGTGITEGASPIDVGNVTEFNLSGLDMENHVYYFVATAYNESGFESDYSNEVSTSSPAAPGGVKVKVTVEVIIE